MLDRTAARPLRAALVTGSPAAGRCGIYDYSRTLAAALDRAGVEVDLVDQRDWSVRGTLDLAQRLGRTRPDVVQMQYPMIVGWRSLGPHAMGYLVRLPQVVTLHEFSTFDRVRQATLAAFARSARAVVMTTAAEAERFLARFPGARSKTTIVPIGSNVPFRPHSQAPQGVRRILYFGQIKPLKGLESFLDLAARASARDLPYAFQVVGAPVTWARDYLASMMESDTGRRVEWLLDRGDDETAALLASASAAYLPYPDGASERRGSLIAALGNGLPVVTTEGPDRPADMDGVVLLADGPGAACAQLEALFSDGMRERALRAAGPDYVRRFDWSVIADRYAAIYREAAAAGVKAVR